MRITVTSASNVEITAATVSSSHPISVVISNGECTISGDPSLCKFTMSGTGFSNFQVGSMMAIGPGAVCVWNDGSSVSGISNTPPLVPRPGPADSEYKTTWIITLSNVTSVAASGPGRVGIAAEVVSDSGLSVELSGTGGFAMHGPRAMKSISVRCCGTSAADFAGSCVDNATVVVSGTSSVLGFTVERKAMLSCSGIGRVKCKRGLAADVRRSCCDLGSITVTKA